ncbi:hypothetical protein [uncultured Limimaricola sp.]|uniref:hypothetical protein n=1 Tax=uncultured Limimaricola sp. TaxID=2211667 RepID=UPI0030FA7853
MIATFLGIPALYGIYKELRHVERSNVQLLSAAFSDNALETQLVNLSRKPAIAYREMSCMEHGVEKHPIKLTVYGKKENSSSPLSNIYIPNESTEAVSIKWDTWNAEVIEAKHTSLDESSLIEIEESLKYIAKNDYNESDMSSTRIAERIIKHLGQGNWTPMNEVFNYHLSLTAKLLAAGVKDLREDYNFKCRISGRDDVEEVEIGSINISFSAGSYSEPVIAGAFGNSE